mmetsp:Transcript_17548/g.32475  ORF Transcript_17548/g.32475 Transcript_17548/m.32475 type:complete len:105 (+) Transcript_17548:1556-1870(+)
MTFYRSLTHKKVGSSFIFPYRTFEKKHLHNNYKTHKQNEKKNICIFQQNKKKNTNHESFLVLVSLLTHLYVWSGGTCYDYNGQNNFLPTRFSVGTQWKPFFFCS